MARVLVVDDEPDILEVAKQLWEDRDTGLQILVARSGRQALDLLEDQQVDLVVTDHRMPGMTGLQLMQELGQRHPGLAVAMMTAYPDPSLAQEARRLGAVGFLQKQEDLETWRRFLQDLLRPPTP